MVRTQYQNVNRTLVICTFAVPSETGNPHGRHLSRHPGDFHPLHGDNGAIRLAKPNSDGKLFAANGPGTIRQHFLVPESNGGRLAYSCDGICYLLMVFVMARKRIWPLSPVF